MSEGNRKEREREEKQKRKGKSNSCVLELDKGKREVAKCHVLKPHEKENN